MPKLPGNYCIQKYKNQNDHIFGNYFENIVRFKNSHVSTFPAYFYDPLHKGKDNWTCLNWWPVAMNVKNLRHKDFSLCKFPACSSIWKSLNGNRGISKVRILKLLKINRMGRQILDVSFFTVSCQFISCHQYVLIFNL